MTEPILSECYWESRLRKAEEIGQLHQAVFRCSSQTWNAIGLKHKKILERLVLPQDYILDVGCGYGELLSLLPSGWEGKYVGIDLSPDLLRKAMELYRDHQRRPGVSFFLLDMRKKDDMGRFHHHEFDWAVCRSIRPMFIRNLGAAMWEEARENLIRVAHQILYLEYDENDRGEVEHT